MITKENIACEMFFFKCFDNILFPDPLSMPCSPNPCKNGGICKAPLGRPVCSCKPGYGGTYCERALTSDSGKEPRVHARNLGSVFKIH